MISVAVVGCGAIGGTVARALHSGEVRHARLTGVVSRNGSPRLSQVSPLPLTSLTHAVEMADLVVEAAGQRALADIAPIVLPAGKSLLVVSAGALREQKLLAALSAAEPGRVHLVTGAIGGLDMLRSAARMGPLEKVRIVTTKKPEALIQPWMTPAEAAALRCAPEPTEIKRGPAREIAGLFPASTNVAATVALAVGDWDLVEAIVEADPAAPLTSHVITASGVAGDYRFEIRNKPSAENPKTSAVVPHSVLKAIEDIAGASAWTFR
jgi:aspartate dehydrogenase